MIKFRWSHAATLIAYGVISSIYIFFSDRVMSSFISDTQEFARLSILKGIGFILVTIGFLTYLLRKERQRTRQIELLKQVNQERGDLLFDNTAISIWEEDFSEVRAALAELRASGVTDLRSYLQDHPAVVHELSAKVEVLDVNQKTLDLTRAKNKEDLLGPLDKTFIEKSTPTLIEELVAIDEGTGHFEGEITGNTVHGEPLDLWLTMNIPPANDPFDHILVTLTDITKLKQIESELTYQKELLQTILDHIPVLIEFYDPDGNLEFVNRAWEQTTGWKLEDIPSGDLMSVFFPDPRLKKCAQDFIHHPEPGWHDFQQVMRDGRQLDITWSRTRLSDGASAGIGQDVTEQRKAEKALRKSHEQLRALTTRLAEVDEDQRRSFAQELHDRVGQTLTAINVNINMIRTLLSDDRDPRIKQRLEDTQALLDSATKQIRDVMASLHPPVLDDYGLPAALRWYGDQIHQRTGLQFDVQTNGIQRLSPSVEIALFRISQEAVNNVIKHAEATDIHIQLHENEREITLEIRDNGIGFSRSDEPKGWGLNIMRERALSVGGDFGLETLPDQGTCITVCVPRKHDDCEHT